MIYLPLFNRANKVKKVETERDDTKVVVYFETIGKKEKCLTMEAFRTHRVANQKPAPVVVYDYYDQSRRARSFYDVVPATLCDICEVGLIMDNGHIRRDETFQYSTILAKKCKWLESRLLS